MPSQPAVPAAAQSVVALVRQDLTSQANVPDGQITTVSVASVSWPDSSLGCPKPGIMYSQIVTPGYRITLQANGTSYEYHTDKGQRFVLCSKP